MAKYFEDADGNKSSKRLNGTWLIWVGLAMGVITWGISLFHPIGNAKTCVELVALFIAFGGGMTSLGVFDNIFKRKKS